MLLVNAVNTEGRPLEIFVKDGRIAAVGQELEALAGENETVIDAGGLTVLPAFVDLHCHWRTPGFEYKEDIETGSRAAAAGGYTFVNLMPNTKPVCSSAAQAFMVEQKAAEVGLCDVNQTVSITENFDGVSIDHLKTLPAGVKFITEDGHGVQDNATMAKAFAICTQKDITVMSHAEDMEISPWDYRLAEDIETVRNCWLSEYYQTKLHMCHVSTRGALDAIQMAKLRGAPVTCEVTPHHLWFTNDTCDYRVNPPIRTADDVQALVDTQKQQYEQYASYFGMSLDDFLSNSGMTDEKLEENARFQIGCTLAIDAIGKAENMTVSDEEYQSGLEELASQYGAESGEAFEEQYGKEDVENSILYDKIMDYVVDQAVVK